MAVAALVITWTLQSRDMQAQRAELELQRTALKGAETALTRSAYVDVRRLHVSLARMALQNPALAEVWPVSAGTDARTQGQYMYANLLLQHVWLQHTAGIATREEMMSNLRYFFASPKMRAYWRDTTASRETIYVEDTEERGLAAAADEIWREYEAVLACSADTVEQVRSTRIDRATPNP